MRTILLLALSSGTLLLPVVCAAQGHSGNSAYALNGPSLGLIFDPASVSIRPVLGIPGAASIGAPLEPGFRSGELLWRPAAISHSPSPGVTSAWRSSEQTAACSNSSRLWARLQS